MRDRFLPVLTVMLLAASAVAADERETVRTIRQAFAAADIEELMLELPVGEARIIGEERDDIELVVDLRCGPEKKRCANRAREVTLESSTRGGRLDVELSGFDDGSRRGMVFDGIIRVPSGMALGIDMGVGELAIEGLSGDVAAELGVGEMTLSLPFDAIHTASLSAGIGETNLLLPAGRQQTGNRSHLVGSETKWRGGSGDADLGAEVGVGEITVVLQ